MSTVQQAQPHSGLKIIRSTDTIPVEHPVFLIYGQPGIGKSSLGFSAKDPITVNFDGKSGLARAVNRREAVDIATIEQFREFRNDRDFLKPFSTVVIDTIGRAVDLMALEVIDDTPKYGRNGSLTLQGFGDLKTRFRLWIADLRAQGKDILFIAHNKEDRDGTAVFNRPDIQEASLSEVLKISDFVGFVSMSGKQRVLDFNPTEQFFGKNPANWKPFNVPEAGKAQDFFAQRFDEGRAALGKISEASATIAQQVNDWKLAIADFSQAEEFNRAIPEILKLQPAPQAQVKKLLMECSKARGLSFDPAQKQFVKPAEPAAVAW